MLLLCINESEVTKSSILDEKQESSENTDYMSFEGKSKWPETNAFDEDSELKPYSSIYNNRRK